MLAGLVDLGDLISARWQIGATLAPPCRVSAGSRTLKGWSALCKHNSCKVGCKINTRYFDLLTTVAVCSPVYIFSPYKSGIFQSWHDYLEVDEYLLHEETGGKPDLQDIMDNWN